MKKYVKWTIGLTAGILVLIMTFMIVIDPLFQYHYPWFGMKPVVTGKSKEQYYVPGMAKNFEYETAIIGTSMSENFRTSWFKEMLGEDTIKLTISGSYPKEYHQVLNLALNHEDTKRIFMNIDSSYLMSQPNTGRWSDLPDYLYDNNVLNDSSYIFNKSIILKNAIGTLRNQKNNTDFDNLFTWDSQYVFSKKEVQKKISSDYDKVSDEYIANIMNYSKENIADLEAYFQNYQDTKFTVFFAPYSIAYWYTQKETGMLDAWEKILLDWYSVAAKYENVDIFFFFNEEWSVLFTDLDNYKDLTHYSSEINKKILNDINEEKCLMNDSNYSSVINNFFDFIRNYDYTNITT